VAVVALVIFLITLFNGAFVSQPQKLLEVPKLVGLVYEELEEYPGFVLVPESVYDESTPAGEIINQTPEAGEQVVENTKVMVTGAATVANGWRDLENYYAMRDLLGMHYMSW
jgi:beta-lactam-binding protein with PASTA domain